MEPRVIMMKQFALITILTVASMVACSDKPAQPEAGAGSEVQLRVELPAAEAAPIDAKLEFQGTVLDLMQKASDDKVLTFKKEGEGEQALITTIQGIGPSGEGDDSKYWIYAVNGKMANVGVGTMKVSGGDEVRWCYLTYENRKSCADNAATEETGAPE